MVHELAIVVQREKSEPRNMFMGISPRATKEKRRAQIGSTAETRNQPIILTIPETNKKLKASAEKQTPPPLPSSSQDEVRKPVPPRTINRQDKDAALPVPKPPPLGHNKLVVTVGPRGTLSKDSVSHITNIVRKRLIREHPEYEYANLYTCAMKRLLEFFLESKVSLSTNSVRIEVFKCNPSADTTEVINDDAASDAVYVRAQVGLRYPLLMTIGADSFNNAIQTLALLFVSNDHHRLWPISKGSLSLSVDMLPGEEQIDRKKKNDTNASVQQASSRTPDHFWQGLSSVAKKLRQFHDGSAAATTPNMLYTNMLETRLKWAVEIVRVVAFIMKSEERAKNEEGAVDGTEDTNNDDFSKSPVMAVRNTWLLVRIMVSMAPIYDNALCTLYVLARHYSSQQGATSMIFPNPLLMCWPTPSSIVHQTKSAIARYLLTNPLIPPYYVHPVKSKHGRVRRQRGTGRRVQQQQHQPVTENQSKQPKLENIDRAPLSTTSSTSKNLATETDHTNHGPRHTLFGL